MTTRSRIIVSCVSFTVFVALLGLLASTYVAAQPEEVKCPCDFGSIPKTEECWVEQFVNPIGPIYTTTDPILTNTCTLFTENFDVAFALVLQVIHEGKQSTPQCMIEPDINNPAACGDPPPHQTVLELTPVEVKACQCELLAYTTALNEVEGITVSGGPPYVCGDVDCRPAKLSPIPTLSEWGLIAMAGILGIVGFMVIRKRKVTA